jgi:hypothetical protein
MKLLIFIPDGVGIKNYLYSDFFDQLLADKEFSISILSTLQKEEIEALANVDKDRVDIYSFPAYREGKERIFREAIRHARLSYFAAKLNNPSMMKYGSNPWGKKSKWALRVARLLGSLYKPFGYGYIQYLERRYQKQICVFFISCLKR